MSNSYDFRRCGKDFIALAHLRSHQACVCSVQLVVQGIPNRNMEQGEVRIGVGGDDTTGTDMTMENAPLAVESGAGTLEPSAEADVDGEAEAQVAAHA